MQLFLKRVFLLVAVFIGLLCVISAYQLYYLSQLWKIIPQDQPVLACDIDTRANTKKINIIGCSNLDFNVDMPTLRTAIPGVNINEYKFAGALNSSYLKYMIAGIRASGNKEPFIVYMPTNLFFRENTFPHHPHFYHFGVSKGYLTFLIKENPMILVSENWRNVYNTAKPYHIPDYQTLFREAKTDHEVDSLLQPGTSFSQCNLPFDRSKHHIKRPDLTPQDAAYFNDIFGKDNYSIVNSPIPNLPDHTHYDYTVFEKEGYNKPLNANGSVVYDSSLFYDQWYHLNKCGREMETKKIITLISSLHL